MTIRFKLILGLCLLLALLGLGMGVVLYALILPEVDHIERRSRLVDLARVEQAIQQELERIHQASRDWGQWDDTYRYASHPNPEYEQTNLTSNWLQQLNMDLLVIVDSSGQRLASRFSERAQALNERLAADTLMSAIVGTALRDGGTGLVESAAGPLLLASARILPTDGKGPPRGTFCFGRLMDDDFARELSSRLHLPVGLSLERAPPSAPRVETLSANKTLAEMTLPLLEEAGSLVRIRMQQTRPYYRQMLNSVRYYLAAIFLAGLVASMAAYLFLRSVLERPILVLRTEAERFSLAHGSTKFQHVDGRDEIGQLARAFADMAERVNDSRQLLERERNRFEQDSLTDPLTGLGNRRLQEQALAADRESDSGDTRLFLFIDLDHFKQVNDRHGHDMGDRVLQQMAELLRRCSRDQDILARSGGEEFTLFCFGIDEASAKAIVERICRETANYRFGDPGRLLGLTCSIGFVLFSRSTDDTYDSECDARFLKLADLALYQAKAAGRNTWVGYSVQAGMAHWQLPKSEAALSEAVVSGALRMFRPSAASATGHS